jgi:hypothetical protein
MSASNRIHAALRSALEVSFAFFALGPAYSAVQRLSGGPSVIYDPGMFTSILRVSIPLALIGFVLTFIFVVLRRKD